MATPSRARLDWPLMRNNITRSDLDALIEFLRPAEPPILTQSRQVQAFEAEWSAWLGVQHSVFVNSGASANLLTMALLRHTHGPGEVIVPTLTWVSDIASVIQNGLEPVFVDIHPRTLGMDTGQVLAKLTPRTRAVFITHSLGYNALTPRLVDELKARGIPLLEDVCEAHGATFQGRKLGTFGWVSNFSFYYAHHMSTIEGGMLCTGDAEAFERLRMLRSHGLVREATAPDVRKRYVERYPDLHPDFIFAYPAYNVRNTEINAVLGRAQLKRLDANNVLRRRNLDFFLKRLDPRKYVTDFLTEGSCNYAFTLVLREPNEVLRDNVETGLRDSGVEFRRGASGGGNQLRQPYLRERLRDVDPRAYPHVDHIHFFGYYIGNYPELEEAKITALCELLNGLPEDRRLA